MKTLSFSRSIGALALTALLFGGCGDESFTLRVDVRTDLVPDVEFDTMRVVASEFDGERGAEGSNWNRAQLVGSWSLTAGTHLFDVRAMLDGEVVASRPVRIELDGDLPVVVVLTRSCSDVECGSQACVAGDCVDPTCLDGSGSSCGGRSNECGDDDDCPSGDGCGFGECEGGVCFVTADDDDCDNGEMCVPDEGCVEDGRPDEDAGPDDAGEDTGDDADPGDAGPPDADEDASEDAGEDGSSDAGPDADTGDVGEPDAPDAGPELGPTEPWSETAYLKASDTAERDLFGTSIAVNGDGTVIAVGKLGKPIPAMSMGAPETPLPGQVFIYRRTGDAWMETSILVPERNGGSQFGAAVALTDDGETVVVGAPSQRGRSVYVFDHAGSDAWTQRQRIEPVGTSDDDLFGQTLQLSQDGKYLVIGAPGDPSGSTSVDGDASDGSAPEAGAAHVYELMGGNYVARAYLKAPNAESFDLFGTAVAVANDGTVVVGAPQEGSNSRGVDGGSMDNNARENAGAAYVFSAGTPYSFASYLKAARPADNDFFAIRVAISSDGTLAAAGAPSNLGLGIAPGEVALFERADDTWSAGDVLTPFYTSTFSFGSAVTFSGDGRTLVIGASGDTSGTRTINEMPTPEEGPISGAIYIMRQDEGRWATRVFIKTSNADIGDEFGSAVAISSDGSHVVGAAISEDGGGRAVGAMPEDNTTDSAGAVYVFTPD